MISNQSVYSLSEDIVNSITHAVGLGMSLAGSAFLISLAILHGNAWYIVGSGIYGASLFVLYLASTLYHGFRNARAKTIFKIVDHASIYLLIAGTYTPFLLVDLRGPWGWSLLGIIWSMAILGVIFKIFLIDHFRKLSTLVYVLMGWLCIIALKQMLLAIPPVNLILIVIGGLIYTAGVIFYAWHRLPYNHAVWHLFVLGGSICHYLSILFLLPTLTV